MKIRIKECATNLCPMIWFREHKKELLTDWMIRYNEYYLFDYNKEYDLLYKDREYALVQCDDKVLCTRLEDIVDEIEVGDYVKVINKGRIYRGWLDWFAENEIEDRELLLGYQFDREFQYEYENEKYQVVYIDKRRYIGLIKSEEGRVWLIGINGLERE